MLSSRVTIHCWIVLNSLLFCDFRWKTIHYKFLKVTALKRRTRNDKNAKTNSSCFVCLNARSSLVCPSSLVFKPLYQPCWLPGRARVTGGIAQGGPCVEARVLRDVAVDPAAARAGARCRSRPPWSRDGSGRRRELPSLVSDRATADPLAVSTWTTPECLEHATLDVTVTFEINKQINKYMIK